MSPENTRVEPQKNAAVSPEQKPKLVKIDTSTKKPPRSHQQTNTNAQSLVLSERHSSLTPHETSKAATFGASAPNRAKIQTAYIKVEQSNPPKYPPKAKARIEAIQRRLDGLRRIGYIKNKVKSQ